MSNRKGFFGQAEKLTTSGLGRLSRTASAAARMGVGSVLGKLRKNEDGWGSLNPADIEKLVKTLGELKGLPMKLGQIFSFVDETLPPEARRLLSLLQTQSQAAPFAEVETTIRQELGDRAAELLEMLEQNAVSSASIGQVHRSSLPDGTPVAVKVQHAGIEEAIANELGAASSIVRYVSALMPGRSLPGFIEEVESRLLSECDYHLEASNQARFYALFAAHPVITIPEVHAPYSARRVLTTTWQPGLSFDAWLASAPDQQARNSVGAALYEFYIGALFRFGLFNADPHPGNYLLQPGPRVVMLDYGCVREYTPCRVDAFVALRQAVLADDPESLRKALVNMGAADPGSGKIYETARRLLRAFFGASLEDKPVRIAPETNSQLGDIMADKMAMMKLSLPGDLLFLFRIKFGLYAVLARIGAECNWRALEEGWIREKA